MIISLTLVIIGAIFGIIALIGIIISNMDVVGIGILLFMIFFFSAIFVGTIEKEVSISDIRTTCRNYCNERGYSYDSIKTEGAEQYCICDTSLERHLIKKNTGVIIE